MNITDILALPAAVLLAACTGSGASIDEASSVAEARQTRADLGCVPFADFFAESRSSVSETCVLCSARDLERVVDADQETFGRIVIGTSIPRMLADELGRDAGVTVAFRAQEGVVFPAGFQPGVFYADGAVLNGNFRIRTFIEGQFQEEPALQERRRLDIGEGIFTFAETTRPFDEVELSYAGRLAGAYDAVVELYELCADSDPNPRFPPS